LRTARLAAAALIAALPAPAPAAAHSGLTSRQNLPIPPTMFAVAAAAVLAVSFVALAVLWPQPRMQSPPWRPLPLGRALASRPVEIVCGTIGVALLVVVIGGGYFGPQSGAGNVAPTFILITFWVGLVFASLLFGDVFRAFSPWRAIGRATGALLGRRAPAPYPYPERLGRWPAAAVLLIFGWIELVGRWDSVPRTLAGAALGYTVITLAAQSVWGTETWSRRGEGFAVYFNLFSRVSLFETRERVLGIRPPLGGLPGLDAVPGTIAVVTVIIGTVSFDGFSQGPVWNAVAPQGDKLAGTLGLLLGVAVVAGLAWLGGGRPFIHTLVPIAAVYVLAHYLTYVVFDGQRILFLASDPFGRGWDVFGTATSRIDYTLLSQNGAWYLEVAFVIVGHVAALTLAHDRALALYRDPRLAVRSQIRMLGVMVVFTMLALWLLFEAGR
jgi:hypothetical protein